MTTSVTSSATSPSAQEQLQAMLSGEGKDIALFKVFMCPEAITAAANTLASGYIGQGPRVDAFEAALQPFMGRSTILTTNSGTSALQLALRLSNVGVGDEVITTAMTCTATNVPIMAQGATIVWADIDPETGNLDVADVARKITPKTKAILHVHWGGYPGELTELMALAESHGIKLIEDAAHAFGATYQGKPIGSHGHFVCYSFQAIKHLTTVDGGAVVCKDHADYERGKLLRWYGIDREGPRKDFRCEEDVKEFGYKFHMNDVSASIGLAQLQAVPSAVLAKHKANGAFYTQRLADAKGLQLLNYKADRESAYWLFTMRVTGGAEKRMTFMQRMKEAGVVVSQVHTRNDSHTMFRAFKAPLPGTELFANEQISIPVGWWLSEAEREHVAQSAERIAASL